MKVIEIEKLNQLVSRTDMSGNEKVEWLTDFIDKHVTEQLRLNDVSQRSELLRVFDSFYDWHKKQGYVSVKRYDFEEYLKTLNCG